MKLQVSVPLSQTQTQNQKIQIRHGIQPCTSFPQISLVKSKNNSEIFDLIIL